MISKTIDPSLHSAEPESLNLDDGFSAPASDAEACAPQWDASGRLEDALACKSDF